MATITVRCPTCECELELGAQYQGQEVECGSCHNPHNTSFPPFLRVSNSGSNLCKTCHIK